MSIIKSVTSTRASGSKGNPRLAISLLMSALIAAGQGLPVLAYPAFSNDSPSTEAKKTSESSASDKAPPQAGATSSPEADSRSASDTVSSVDAQIEKKLDQDILNKNNSQDLIKQPGAASPGSAGSASTGNVVPGSSTASGSTSPGAGNLNQGGAAPEGSSAYKVGTSGAVDPQHPLAHAQASSLPASREVRIEHPSKPVDVVAGQGGLPMPKEGKGATKLFGRIEQLSAEGDVKLPSLQMQTAKLDLRGNLSKQELETYSGSIAKTFPTDFLGVWGGQLAVWSYNYSPTYLSVDKAEAEQSAVILKRGRSGAVNFQFYRDRTGKIALEPANVLLSIPMKDSYSFSKMMQGSGGMQSQMGPFAGAFNQMMGNMEAPIVMLHFGNVTTSSMETGVSGNQFRSQVVKNVIRELGPGVLEEQIVTKSVSRVATTGKTVSGYDESVLRFKRLSDSKFYVLAASVKYTGTGKYLSKLIMYGTVDKGHMMQTNPYANMQQMMGQMMNLQNMQGMMGGNGRSNGSVTVPHGGYSMPGGLPSGFPMQMPGGGQMPTGFPMQMPGGGDLNELMRQMQQQMQQ